MKILDIVSLSVAFTSLCISLLALRYAVFLTKHSIIKPLLLQELFELLKWNRSVGKGGVSNIRELAVLLHEYQKREFILKKLGFSNDLESVLKAWNKMIESAKSNSADSMDHELVKKAFQELVSISNLIERRLFSELDNPFL